MRERETSNLLTRGERNLQNRSAFGEVIVAPFDLKKQLTMASVFSVTRYLTKSTRYDCHVNIHTRCFCSISDEVIADLYSALS